MQSLFQFFVTLPIKKKNVEVHPYVQREAPVFQFVPTASCDAGHHWKEPASIPLKSPFS